MKARLRKVISILARICFVIYLIALVYFLFFCEQFGRMPSENYRYNFVPFQEIARYIRYRHNIGWNHFMINVFGNILCFMPFGFALPILSEKQRHWWKVTGQSFLASFLIEGIQLVSKVGSCDVDDIILNTCGGALGYLLFVIGLQIWRKIPHGEGESSKML